MEFSNINNIDINNDLSWNDKLFLTFDIDWCSDEVLMYTLKIIEEYDIKATFFITHETPLLDRMINNPKIEVTTPAAIIEKIKGSPFIFSNAEVYAPIPNNAI